MRAESKAILRDSVISRRQGILATDAKGIGLRLFWHILPLAGVLVLMGLLVAASGITRDQMVSVFEAVTIGHVAAFFAVTVAMQALSAAKWRMVMQHLPAGDSPPPLRSSAFLYTCLGAVLSFVLMPHVAKHAGRALGAKFHGGLPAGKSVAASLFEQVFDLVMIVVLAAFGAILLAPVLTPYIAGALGLGTAAVLFVLRRPQMVPARFHLADLLALLRRPVALRLCAISLGFYLLTALRTFIVAIPAGIALLPVEFFASFSLVQLSRLIAITPMGLGVADWTWASVLGLLHIPLALAAGFVILMRVLDLIATLAAFALAVVLAKLVGRS
ncbi:MAG: lysylphosphatidylglycerol synthase domain-containing protein [Pseudomonadota bacterium]